MKLISVKEGCVHLSVSDKTIRNWIDEGKLKKYEDDKGNILVEKKQLLKMKPTNITLFNQKGGCGKTSSSVIIADYYDKLNEKILLVDLDQQANLSQTFFSYEELKESLTLYDYFSFKTPLNKIIKSYNSNIDCLPASIKLARNDSIDTSMLVKIKADFLPLFKKYSIVILDCPPSLNSFSRFGVLMANYVLCPVVPEPYSYDGLDEVLSSIRDLKEFNRDFSDFKVFISSHKQHKTVIRENYVDLIKNELDGKIFKNSIPDFVGVVERATSRKNIFDMYSSDKSIDKINELMSEIDRYIFDERGIIDG